MTISCRRPSCASALSYRLARGGARGIRGGSPWGAGQLRKPAHRCAGFRTRQPVLATASGQQGRAAEMMTNAGPEASGSFDVDADCSLSSGGTQ
jgi:hypothetical protein